VQSEPVDPRQARAAILLSTLGLLLTLTGAALLGRPSGWALVTLPVAALAVVLWRARSPRTAPAPATRR
jgi:hypothetical protein